MLRMRLQRRGKKNFATFRVVVADQRAPVKGSFIADLGPYNPHTNVFSPDPEAVKTWLAKGVQPSDTVHNLLVTHGLLKAEKVTIWRPPVKAQQTPAPATTPEAPAAAPETPTEAAPETK